MSLIRRLLDGAETRDSTLAEPESALLAALGGTPTAAGKSVTVESSMRLVPVFSAVSLIAGAVGSLPLVVYRRLEPKGRERATDHRTWRMLHDQPNPEHSSDELWEMVTAFLLLWGNAYLLKVRDRNGLVVELWPLSPPRMGVYRDHAGGPRLFSIDGNKGYTEKDVLHIRGLGTDGFTGLSPIGQAREMLGASAAQEEFTGTFWDKSANPGGFLTHPAKLSPEAADRLRARWRALHSGSARAGEVAVLEEGMTWQAAGMPLRDAQFIETQQMGDLRVAQLFNLPPHKLGAKSGDSMTYSNVESESIDFVRWTLRRWLVRIEKALLRDADLFVQGTRFFPEFLVDGILRSDTKTRYEAYGVGLDKGFLSIDEVREWENLNPDDKPAPPAPPPAPPSEDPPADEPADPPDPPAPPADPGMNGNGGRLVGSH